MSDNDITIAATDVSRMFKRYRRPRYRVMEAFGLPLPKGAYDEFWALRGISLEVRRGESLGIIGQNGAGKSTLLNIICGRMQPTSGSVSVRGNIQALMDLGTGFHPEFSGRDNILSALAYQGLTGRAARAWLEEIVDFSELAEFIDQPLKTYSTGMYARLAFSTATAIVPDVLIIDEVLGAGDAYFAAKSAERMLRLTQESGATVLFVSHDMAAVQRLCERAVWIDRGRIRMIGATLDISKSYYADVVAREEARLRAQTTLAIARMRRRDGESLGRGAEAELASAAAGLSGPAEPDIAAVAKAVDGACDLAQTSPRERWDSDEAHFTDVCTCDGTNGALQHTFGLGEPIVFRIGVELAAAVPECWLACSIFDALGNRVSLLVHEFQDGLELGSNEIMLRVNQINLRQGEYVVSFELLPVFDYSWPGPHRLPYLCHWDRCIYFKINEDYHGTLALGLIALPIVVSSRRLQSGEPPQTVRP